MSYENPWIWEGEVFDTEDIGSYEGFVYLIVNKTNGKKYVGRKYFWERRKNGKARRSKKESKWKEYYGSCDELHEDIEKLGKENFSRTILSLHETRGSTNYGELEEQIKEDVLFREDYYNGIVGKFRNVKRGKKASM